MGTRSSAWLLATSLPPQSPRQPEEPSLSVGGDRVAQGARSPAKALWTAPRLFLQVPASQRQPPSPAWAGACARGAGRRGGAEYAHAHCGRREPSHNAARPEGLSYWLPEALSPEKSNFYPSGFSRWEKWKDRHVTIYQGYRISVLLENKKLCSDFTVRETQIWPNIRKIKKIYWYCL